MDEELLARLPLGPGERERHMQIELACRYYANGWLSFAQAARLANSISTLLGLSWGSVAFPGNTADEGRKTSLMRVVSNTSPISNLAIIDRLELLKRRYSEIWIPAEVARELSAMSHTEAQARIQAALAIGS